MNIDRCMEIFETRKQNRKISSILKTLKSSVLINKDTVLKELLKMEEQQRMMSNMVRKISTSLGM